MCGHDRWVAPDQPALLTPAAAETGETPIDFKELNLNRLQLEEADRLLTLEEWKFTYLHSDDVDCFVNHYAPRRIFITKGMLDLCKKSKSDAPLAMAIGHELSHTILNHGENDEWLDVGLKMMQLMVLSLLDPTGLFTLGLEAGLVFTSPLARTHYSKDQTTKADSLSLKITSHACFRPEDSLRYLTLLQHSGKHEGTLAAAAAEITEVELPHTPKDLLPPASGLANAHDATVSAVPQPSQVGFADGMFQRLLSNSAEGRKENVQSTMAIAHDIFDENGCASWRHAADEFLSHVATREKQRLRYQLEEVGRQFGVDPNEDDGGRLLSAADVGGIAVGTAAITVATLAGALASVARP